MVTVGVGCWSRYICSMELGVMFWHMCVSLYVPEPNGEPSKVMFGFNDFLRGGIVWRLEYWLVCIRFLLVLSCGGSGSVLIFYFSVLFRWGGWHVLSFELWVGSPVGQLLRCLCIEGSWLGLLQVLWSCVFVGNSLPQLCKAARERLFGYCCCT
jgi:hypothetical protein